MRLPTIKKILREDLKDAPSWVTGIIDPLNSFMESVYQSLNRNITFRENISCFIKELSYKTPSTYPVMDDMQFSNDLKTKAIGVQILQIVDSAYVPPSGSIPGSPPWVETNGVIAIKPIPGLEADKTYTVRLLVT